MKREDGYILIDECQKIVTIGTHRVGTVCFNTRLYYFKSGTVYENYVEVFSSLIAKHLDIPTVSYDLAKIGSSCGVISEDFSEGYDYIYFEDILNKYYSEVICEFPGDYPFEMFIENSFNLETVWWALEYYYKDYENKDRFVKSLMDSVVDSFILQVLIGNSDLNVTNLAILNKPFPVLAKNFDYGNANLIQSGIPSYNFNLQVFPLNFSDRNLPLDTIKTFLAASSEEFLERFEAKFQLMPNKELLFKEIISMTENDIPDKVKGYLGHGYDDYLEQIGQCLKEVNELKR